jgi:hypothetical protein
MFLHDFQPCGFLKGTAKVEFTNTLPNILMKLFEAIKQ